ncbi:phosphatidylinositol-3,5-bisphosphate 5-phosphatase [Savitreella phatthalungensis]
MITSPPPVKPTDLPHTQEPVSPSRSAVTHAGQETSESSAPALSLSDAPLVSFRVYETTSRYYIVGATQKEDSYLVLKIDRTVEEAHFVLEEDGITYSRKQITDLLATIDDGNRSTGGLRRVITACGIIGMIRFTSHYYLWLVMKRSIVAVLGGHYVYHIEDTKLLPLTASTHTNRAHRAADEARYMAILNNVQINKHFYFSNSYDITHTLQYNLAKKRQATRALPQDGFLSGYNDMFVWNHYLLHTAFARLESRARWCVPIVHGFIDQAKIMVFGRPIFLTLVARRSRHFAGARFLKRGANQAGWVANDVETEQIVADGLTTSFCMPDGLLSRSYTSFVQHRGSIPLSWSQTVDGVTPKPPIELNVVDPFFSSAALHFDDMFERYGSPIFVVNLIKARERTPREVILLNEFNEMIDYLNHSLPEKHKLRYIAWDMSRASKSREQEVITTLERIASQIIDVTGFFRSDGVNAILQQGVARTNCIDCLDRTNAAQFVIGKLALALQLKTIGVIDSVDSLMWDCDAVSMLVEMYHDHGDTIALQYGGSHLVNTMETYRKLNQWTSHSRDMLESIRRFYNNSFLDAQRQEAINLFLGNFDPTDTSTGTPNLWELDSDNRLHNRVREVWDTRRHYDKWFTQELLTNAEASEVALDGLRAQRCVDPDYWDEYYKPNLLSTINKVFAFSVNSTGMFAPQHTHSATSSAVAAAGLAVALPSAAVANEADASPFVVRTIAPAQEEQVARSALDACGGTNAAADSLDIARITKETVSSALSLVGMSSGKSISEKSIAQGSESTKSSRTQDDSRSATGTQVNDPKNDLHQKVSLYRWLGPVISRQHRDPQHTKLDALDNDKNANKRVPPGQAMNEVRFTTAPVASSTKAAVARLRASRHASLAATSQLRNMSIGGVRSRMTFLPASNHAAAESDQRRTSTDAEQELASFVQALLSTDVPSEYATFDEVMQHPNPSLVTDDDLAQYSVYATTAPKNSPLPRIPSALSRAVAASSSPYSSSNESSSAAEESRHNHAQPASSTNRTRVARFSRAAKHLFVRGQPQVISPTTTSTPGPSFTRRNNATTSRDETPRSPRAIVVPGPQTEPQRRSLVEELSKSPSRWHARMMKLRGATTVQEAMPSPLVPHNPHHSRRGQSISDVWPRSTPVDVSARAGALRSVDRQDGDLHYDRHRNIAGHGLIQQQQSKLMQNTSKTQPPHSSTQTSSTHSCPSNHHNLPQPHTSRTKRQ